MKLEIIELRYPYKAKIFEVERAQQATENKAIYFYVPGRIHYLYEVRENVLNQLEFIEFTDNALDYEFARKTKILSWKLTAL